MKRLIRITLVLVIALSIASTSIGFSFQTAFAQGEQPPEQQVEATLALIGPKSTLKGPNGVIIGPGSQRGTLSSIIGWYGQYWARGRSKITLQGSPTAKAWTTFSYTTPSGGGGQLETTANNPCWTTTSCTSSTQYHPGFPGYTYLNFAETTIYWSNGTQSYANATVTKTF